MKKSLTQKLKEAKEQIKLLEFEKKQIEDDRSKFRAHFENRLKWWIELHGKGSSPNISFLIETDAKFLANVKKWYW